MRTEEEVFTKKDKYEVAIALLVIFSISLLGVIYIRSEKWEEFNYAYFSAGYYEGIRIEESATFWKKHGMDLPKQMKDSLHQEHLYKIIKNIKSTQYDND